MPLPSCSAVCRPHSFFLVPLQRPARSSVSPVGHGPRAGPATDARETLVVQRIVGHALVGDPLPNVFLRPIRQRADLHQAEFLVPTDDRGPGPVGTLVATDAAHPGVHHRGRPLQCFDLAIEAALVGLRLVERPIVQQLRTPAHSAPAATGRPRCHTSPRSGRAGRASPETGSRSRD